MSISAYVRFPKESTAPDTHLTEQCPVSPNCLMMKSYPPSCKNSSLCPELRSQSFPLCLGTGLTQYYAVFIELTKLTNVTRFPHFLLFRKGYNLWKIGVMMSIQIVDRERKPHGRLIALLRSLNKE